MCGICGIINFDGKKVSSEDLHLMMREMKHRGPDDEGIYENGNIGLGHVRLSIIDLSEAGKQPFFSDDGRYVMVYNGEIYNYIEIRDELKYKYKFFTKTDSEVLMKAFLEWGENCFNKFNGMFALAIYDTFEKSLLCIRDRFGVKPFYYYLDDNKFIFSSEIPPILKIYNFKNQPNNLSIYNYLVFNRTDYNENTFFQDVKKIPHGHKISFKIYDKKTFSINKWYDLKLNISNPFQSYQEFIDLFYSSINLRLRSDVNLGLCLSGGLDSSSIVSMLLKKFDIPKIETFSAIYSDDFIFDEKKYIEIISDKRCIHNYAYPSNESLIGDMDMFLSAQAEPHPSTSIYAEFKVMELARKNNIAVMIGGQGSDEQFSGYHYFFGYYFKSLLKQFKISDLYNEIKSYKLNHNSYFAHKTFIYFLLPEFLKQIISAEKNPFVLRNYAKKYYLNSTLAGELFGVDTLQKSLLAHFEYKLEHLLKWEDHNSMHFSIETRIPFLDYRIVEKTLGLSESSQIKNGWTKHFLREAMKDILPEEIRLRKDKVGYMTPESFWFKSNKFRNYVSSLFKEERLSCKFVDINKFNNTFHSGKYYLNTKDIWKTINLELWLRRFFA